MIDITPIALAFVAVVATAAFGWLFVELRRARARLADYIARNTGLSPEQAAELLGQVAGAAVLAAQQIYGAASGEEKLDYAKQYVTDFLEEFGITLDVGLVAGAIEAALYQAKQEYGDNWR